MFTGDILELHIYVYGMHDKTFVVMESCVVGET